MRKDCLFSWQWFSGRAFRHKKAKVVHKLPAFSQTNLNPRHWGDSGPSIGIFDFWPSFGHFTFFARLNTYPCMMAQNTMFWAKRTLPPLGTCLFVLKWLWTSRWGSVCNLGGKAPPRSKSIDQTGASFTHNLQAESKSRYGLQPFKSCIKIHHNCKHKQTVHD